MAARAPQHRSRWVHPPLRSLSRHDWAALLKDAARSAQRDRLPNLAQAVAYNAFIAIPAALLVALGVFTVAASPATVESMLNRLDGVLPADAVRLLGDGLRRQVEHQASGWPMIVVGLAIALWGLSGAMLTLIWALNAAFECEETRGFVRLRLTAVAMIAALLAAVALVGGLLILGPVVSDWVGNALGVEALTGWLWWVAQWPILLVGLSAAFAIVLWVAPNVEHPRFTLITPGTLVAVAIWLVASAGFAFYSAAFASYNKTWGSIAGVIVMLTWLWLSALALLLGGEITAALEAKTAAHASPADGGGGMSDGQFAPGEAREQQGDRHRIGKTKGAK